MSLTKTPIVDKNGHASHRWMKPADTDSSVARVAGISTSKPDGVISLAGMPVPELSFEKLYHVGELDMSKKKGWSLEGSGMSVSRNPLAWRKIAWLEGSIHEFDVADNRFLDWYELSSEQKDAINEWGIEKGYLESTTLYKVSYWDDELDDESFLICETLEEATEEAEMREVEPEPFEGYVATDLFPDRKYIGTATNYDQVIAAVWVNEEAPELDGVWWADRLDTSRDSAPRGVLAGNKIAEWISSSQVADESTIDEDEDEYEDYDYEDDE